MSAERAVPFGLCSWIPKHWLPLCLLGTRLRMRAASGTTTNRVNVVDGSAVRYPQQHGIPVPSDLVPLAEQAVSFSQCFRIPKHWLRIRPRSRRAASGTTSTT